MAGVFCFVIVRGRSRRGLEIHLSVVVAALQQLFHFFLVWLARVGAGAGVQEGIGCDVDDVRAVFRKGGTRLVGHGMNDAQEPRRECDAGQALSGVHIVARGHVLRFHPLFV